MKSGILASCLLFISSFTAVQAQTTQKLSATKANDYAIVYSLPKTAIDITIVTRKTVEIPGEFYEYAKSILNVDNPITEESTKYSIDKVIIRTHGEPNADERYAVKFSSGSAPYILLSADNVPLAVNTEEVYVPVKEEIPAPERAEATALQNPAARQVVTEEMLRSTTPLKKAQLAAEQLYTLRQGRTDLLTGQADQMPPDGQAMQLIMDNLNAQEAALTAMFLGTKQTSTEVKTFTFIPPTDTTLVKGYIIARLSQTEGLVAADDLSGAPIKLNYQVTQKGEMPVNEKGVTLTFPKNGFAYCIPGKAKVEVNYDGRQIAESTINVAQAGVVYGLAPNSFTDKKSPVYLIFDPSTGAAIEIGSKQ